MEWRAMLAPNTDIQNVLKAAGGPGWLRLARKPWVWAVAVAVVAALAALAWFATRSAPAVVYRTASTEIGNLAVLITATGTIQPINEVAVGSELSGIVASVEVDYNDRVTAGEVLARLDTTKLEAQLASSEAGAVSARAGVTQAKATVSETSAALNRTRTLHGRGIVTQRDLDTAEAAYNRAVASEEVAEAQLKVAEADVTSRRTDLDKAAIASPINGIVLKRDVYPGQTVAASLQAPVLFTIAEDLTQMNLVVDVDEADAAQVADGQTATFTVAAHPDRTFPATVRQVRYFPQTVNNVVTYQAVLAVDNSDLALRPGMTATAEIKIEGKDDVLVVPNAALRFSPTTTSNFGGRGGRSPLSFIAPRPSGGGNRQRSAPEEIPAGSKRIWVLESGEALPRVVGVGATDGTRTEITSGNLKAGDEVITDAVETR
jgi:HlyD family secretion protein